MRSAGGTFLSLCGVAVLVGGLAAALALVLIPLRLVAVTGTYGYCGPGLSSDNALQVRADPGIVNTGAGAGQQAPGAAQRQLERVCTSQANGRLIAAGGTAAVALVAGLPMIAVGRRRRQDSISASSSGPSSLSSSGTSGSTVWK
jgi:hypothetical protein